MNNPITVIAIITTTFIIAIVTSIAVGSAKIDVLSVLAGDAEGADKSILLHVRLPRVLSAVLAGSALAVSGVIIQAVLNNSMASPNIIGVNSGAGLCAIVLIALFPKAYSFLPTAAFFGAVAACLCIYAISAKTGADKMTITLVGIAVGSILSAGISTVKTVFPDSMYDSNTFLVGGLSGITYSRLSPAYFIILAALVFSFILAKDIDVLSLGEKTAKSLGMNVRLTRFLLIITACALAGSAVSFAGLIGFVGLIVPHIARKLVGVKHRLLIPVSALGGATLVLICDIIARVLFAPYEIPVGIILSFVGGPFFISLIMLQRRKRHI